MARVLLLPWMKTKRYGLEKARRFADWQKSTGERVASILQSENMNAEKTGKNEIGFAHRPNRAEGMRKYVDYSNKINSKLMRGSESNVR